jgi:hypothetical protein
MLTMDELRRIAAQKLLAAKTVLTESPDDAVHLAGYAVELQLKARIAETLTPPTWPSDRREFRARKLRHLQTHDLHDLLVLSGRELAIKAQHMARWSICVTWNPESRYNPVGTVTPAAAAQMLEAVEVLLGYL